jgi:hypothetical protein
MSPFCHNNKAQQLVSSVHMGLDLQAMQASHSKATCLTKDMEACLPFLYFLNVSVVSLDHPLTPICSLDKPKVAEL